jgi:hypothetical protein
MKGIDLVRLFYPEANDEFCDYILWEKTSFPFTHGEPEKEFKEQLLHLKRAEILGRGTCNLCGKIRFGKQLNNIGVCKYCDKALKCS